MVSGEWGHYTASIHCRTYCPGPASQHTAHLVLLQSRNGYLVVFLNHDNTVMYTQAQYVKREEAHTSVLHCHISSFRIPCTMATSCLHTQIGMLVPQLTAHGPHQFGQQISLQKMSQFQVETICLRICLHKFFKCESTTRLFLQDTRHLPRVLCTP